MVAHRRHVGVSRIGQLSERHALLAALSDQVQCGLHEARPRPLTRRAALVGSCRFHDKLFNQTLEQSGSSGGVERGEQILARSLAAPALLRAEATVLVVLGMALALIARCATRGQAGLHRRAADWAGSGSVWRLMVRRGVVAGVRAVQAEADAADHVVARASASTRVRADRAGRLAGCRIRRCTAPTRLARRRVAAGAS